MVIDYKGSVIHECDYAGEGFAAGTIDIEALRWYRVNSKFQNFLKDLRVEQYKIIYEAAEAMGGIFPKNLWMERPPGKHAEVAKIFTDVIQKLPSRHREKLFLFLMIESVLGKFG